MRENGHDLACVVPGLIRLLLRAFGWSFAMTKREVL